MGHTHQQYKINEEKNDILTYLTQKSQRKQNTEFSK